MLLRLLLAIYLLLRATNSQVAIINDNLHFYELTVKRLNDIKIIDQQNFQQSFAFKIGANGECAKIASEGSFILNEDFSNEKAINDELELKSSVEIYPGQEQLLSLVAKIEFKSLNDIYDDIAAYEVVFERNGTMSCFQIIPNVDNPMKDFRNEFKLILKDPSLTINNDRFLFYFSKVSIRPLIRCEKEDDRDDMMVMNQRKSAASLRDYTGKRLCALDKLQSQKIDVGIELAKTANPMQRPIRYLEPDTCNGHLMSQTCILRYRKPYYIILTPATDTNQIQCADLDVFRADERLNELVTEAREQNKSILQVDGVGEINPAEFNPILIDYIPHIEFNNKHKSSYGLIMKIVANKASKVNYVAELRDSKCSRDRNESTMCYCKRDKEIRSLPCYAYTQDEYNPNIPLNSELENARSATCDTKFFNQFDFSNTNLANERFQNDMLWKRLERIDVSSSSRRLSNRNFLPTMCFNVTSSATRKYFFNVAIVLNDVHKTAQSSLFERSAYTIKLYHVTYKRRANSFYSRFDLNGVIKVDSKLLVASTTLVHAGDMIEIDELKQGVYMIEMSPVEKSQMCNGASDLCVDESPDRNQPQCVKCNKLVTIFALENTQEDHNNQQQPQAQKSPSSKSYISKRSINNEAVVERDVEENAHISCKYIKARQDPTLRVRKADLSRKNNERVFKCSQLSTKLQNTLLMHTRNISTPAPTIRDPYDNAHTVFVRREIYAAVVVNAFNASGGDLRLPAQLVNSVENLFQEFCLADVEDFFGAKFYALVAVVLLFSLFVLVAVFFMCLSINSKELFYFHNYRVVFYVSMFVNQHDQKLLSKFVRKYVQTLQKKFARIEFFVLDYTTPRNAELITESDVAFYILGSENEATYLSSACNELLVGESDFHVELFKLLQHPALTLVRFASSLSVAASRHEKKKPAPQSSIEDEIHELNGVVVVNGSNNLHRNSMSDEYRPTTADTTAPTTLTTSTTSSSSSSSAAADEQRSYIELPKDTRQLIYSLIVSHQPPSRHRPSKGFMEKTKCLFVEWMKKLNENSLIRSLNSLHRHEIRHNPKLFAFQLQRFTAQPLRRNSSCQYC